MEFKEGDRVKVKDTTTHYHEGIRGKHGTIEFPPHLRRPDKSKTEITLDQEIDYFGRTSKYWIILKSELEKIEEFKVEDRIQVISNPDKHCNFLADQFGTIKHIDDGEYTIEFDLEHIKLHNGNTEHYKGKPKHCWVFSEGKEMPSTSNLIKIERQQASITTNKDDLPPGYIKTSEGFITNPDNWKRKNRLF